MPALRMLVYMIILSLACAPKMAVKMMPSPELEYTDGILTFMAKQVLNGEDFEVITLDPYSHSVGLALIPIATDPTHRKLAELIYKEILSREEFQGQDGLLSFRTDTFYGFTACWLMDVRQISIVKFAEMADKKVSDILRAYDLWREIMLLGGKEYYINGAR